MTTINSKTIRELAMTEVRGTNDIFQSTPLSCTEKEKYDACVRVATEQDRIARQEERERCIKAAQRFFCDNFCDKYVDCRACNQQEKIRKAMEGNNNDTI